MTVQVRWTPPVLDDDPVLDPAERRRAAGFHRHADRARFVTGRVALRDLVGATLDCAPGDVRFGTVGRGKPVVTAPHHLDVGVAHAADVVLVAVGGGPFGIDVEPPPTTAVVEEVAPTVCSAGELAALAALTAAARPAAFARCWARKEAIVQADGAGLAIDPAGLTVGVGPVPVDGAVAGWHVRDLALPTTSVAAAIATAAPGTPVVVARWAVPDDAEGRGPKTPPLR